MTMTTPAPNPTQSPAIDADNPAAPFAVIAQARELDDLRTAIKALEDRSKVLRASLLDHLDAKGVDSVSYGKVSVSRSTHERESIDRKRMEALYPKVYADVRTTASVIQVRVKVQ